MAYVDVAAIRNSCAIVNEFRKSGVMFIPVPVVDNGDYIELNRLMNKRVEGLAEGSLQRTEAPADKLEVVAWRLRAHREKPDDKLVHKSPVVPCGGDKALVTRDNALSVMKAFREALAVWYENTGYLMDESEIADHIRSFSVTEIPDE